MTTTESSPPRWLRLAWVLLLGSCLWLVGGVPAVAITYDGMRAYVDTIGDRPTSVATELGAC